MHSLLKKLQGGDRRSIGKSSEVVSAVLKNPGLFPVVFRGMTAEDPLTRMRYADAAEKISALRPDLLQAHKRRLLREVAAVDQQEVRLHAAQMIPRLTLTGGERRAAAEILTGYLRDDSRIVQTFALQALADLAEQDPRLRPGIVRKIARLVRTGSPAVRSRGRKLLDRLIPRGPVAGRQSQGIKKDREE